MMEPVEPLFLFTPETRKKVISYSMREEKSSMAEARPLIFVEVLPVRIWFHPVVPH